MNSKILVAGILILVIAAVIAIYRHSPSTGESRIDSASPEPAALDKSPRELALESESEPISMMDLSDVRIGESFSLYIPQEDRIVQGSVERSHDSKAGNRVLHGRIRDGDRSHSFIVTVGRYQTFGSIQTSRDRYQFELSDGEGELIAQSTLNEKRDFSKPDFVIPERKARETNQDSE